MVARLVTGCVRTHSCVRETCVRRLPAAWGVTGCRGSLPFAQECRLGVWFGVGCTASCGWNVRCVGVRGDAWSVMLSPCNTEIGHRFVPPQRLRDSLSAEEITNALFYTIQPRMAWQHSGIMCPAGTQNLSL